VYDIVVKSSRSLSNLLMSERNAFLARTPDATAYHLHSISEDHCGLWHARVEKRQALLLRRFITIS